MLIPAQVDEIARRHEVGSHSHSHESMGYETNEYFQADFERSRAWLAGRGLPCDIYAFPNGSYRDEQVRWLIDQNVRHTLLVDETFSRAGLRSVPRLTVGGGSIAELELAALGLSSLRRIAPVAA